MAYPSTLYVSPEGVDPKVFVRVENESNKSRYKDVSTVNSPSILLNELLVRTTEKGSPRDPLTHKRSLNLARQMEVMVSGVGVFAGSVNLTVNIPGGNVFTTATIKAMVAELIALTVDLGSAGVAPGAIFTEEVSDVYVQSVQLLLTE